jgi:myosin heavy subunit
VFDREQSLYKAEGLNWQSIEYRDNQHVIDMICRKPNGLLIVLEQQGILNRGSKADEAALLASFNQFHDKKSPAYEKSRFGNDGLFTLRHFAGNVTYSISGIYLYIFTQINNNRQTNRISGEKQ